MAKIDWVNGEIVDADALNALGSEVTSLTARAVSVKDHGAVGDGTTNNTVAFTAAIAAASAQLTAMGGGNHHIKVYVPAGVYRLGAVSLPLGVWLVGNGAQLKPVSGMSGTMITLADDFSGIRNLRLFGNGNSEPAAEAVHVASGTRRATIIGCEMDQWAGRVIHEEGSSTWIQRVYADGWRNNTVANALADYTGVVDLKGDDPWVTDCEFSGSRYPSLGASSSMKACAMRVDASNSMISNVVCEQADHGIYLSNDFGYWNSFVGVRAEINYGHGWFMEGPSITSRLVNCQAWSNSLAANNTWDGFHINTGNFVMTNCATDSNGPETGIKHRYGFYKSAAATAKMVNCHSIISSQPDNVGYRDAATSTSYTALPPVGVRVAVPSTATSTGTVDQWAADGSFYYICTAANTWRRVAIASW